MASASSWRESAWAVEVAARVEALGLLVLGGQEERAVGDRAQLARDLAVELRELVERGAVDLGEHAEGHGRLRAVASSGAARVQPGQQRVDALPGRDRPSARPIRRE